MAVGLFVGLIIASLSFIFFRQTRPTGIFITPPAPTTTPQPTVTPSPINIDVKGEVVNAGVFALPAGGIVQDAISEAGGFTANADVDLVNLAQPLSNGMEIRVPAVGDTLTGPVVRGGESVTIDGASKVVNINTASLAELETLPNIGPSIAQRIIEYREANGPFTIREDIKSVNGIGEGTYEQIEGLITID
jgi:competence protein ComEA